MKFCEDIRAHKKYFFAVKEYPEDIVITLADGSISPYTEWKMEYSGAPGNVPHIWLAAGVGAVLYPPHCLSCEVLNVEALKKLCLQAGDIWLKFMEVMNGTKTVPAYHTSRIHGFSRDK